MLYIVYMYVHTRERDIRPGFDGVKIKFYYYYYTINVLMKSCDSSRGLDCPVIDVVITHHLMAETAHHTVEERMQFYSLSTGTLISIHIVYICD